MKKILSGIVLITTLLTGITACGDKGELSEASGEPSSASKELSSASKELSEIDVFQLTPSEDGVDAFLQRLDDYSGYGYDDEKWYSVAPAEITEKYGFAIYKSDKSCNSILVYDDEEYTLGECFGGFGADSFAVADLNGDGYAELYFTFSWGSGLPRAQAGYFDAASREVVVFDYSYLFSEMMTVSENGGLYIYSATDDIHSFVDIELTAEEPLAEITYNGETITFTEKNTGAEEE